MRQAMERVGRYCAGLDFDGFCANELIVDGVIRNLEVMGEAAKKVPVLVQQAPSQLPWSQMYRMRNRISHEYFGLDYATIWRVALHSTFPRIILVAKLKEKKRVNIASWS